MSAVGRSADYELGTIVSVTARASSTQNAGDVTQYDVAVKVGDTTYKTLYTAPAGASIGSYHEGTDILVLVGDDTLTLSTKVSGNIQVSILSRETLPSKGMDLSKAPSQYFSMKLQHLSKVLSLTPLQQTEIKPVLEQEVGEVGEVCGNPVYSEKEKFKRYQQILRASDVKITPLLSPAQLQALQTLRSEQKQNLKKIMAEQNGCQQY